MSRRRFRPSSNFGRNFPGGAETPAEPPPAPRRRRFRPSAPVGRPFPGRARSRFTITPAVLGPAPFVPLAPTESDVRRVLAQTTGQLGLAEAPLPPFVLGAPTSLEGARRLGSFDAPVVNIPFDRVNVARQTFRPPRAPSRETMRAFLRAAISTARRRHGADARLSVIFRTDVDGDRADALPGDRTRVVSTRHVAVRTNGQAARLLGIAMRKYASIEDEYDGGGNITAVTISGMTALGGAGLRARGPSASTGEFRAPLSNKGWYIVDPTSTSNCAWQAVAICTGWVRNRALLTDAVVQGKAGRDLKSAVSPDNTQDVGPEEWKALAQYKGVNLKLLNSRFQVVETHKAPGNHKRGRQPVVNVVVFNGHAYAAIRTQKLRAAGVVVTELPKVPTMTASGAEPQGAVKTKKTAPIVATVDNGKPPTTRIAAYDLEAYPDEHGNFVPYGIGWAFRDADGEVVYKRLWGLDCIAKFLEALAAMDDPPKVWYAHNGGRFDALFIVKELVAQTALKIEGMVELNGLMQVRVENPRLRVVGGKKDARTVVHAAYKAERAEPKVAADAQRTARMQERKRVFRATRDAETAAEKVRRAVYSAELKEMKAMARLGLYDDEELEEYKDAEVVRRKEEQATRKVRRAEERAENTAAGAAYDAEMRATTVKPKRETVRPFVMSFQDSMRMLVGGLHKLTKQMGVEHVKLEGEVDHDAINADTWRHYLDHGRLEPYLENDVLGLFEVMEQFNYEVLKAEGIAPADCLTGASLSKRVCFRNYLAKHEDTRTLPDPKGTGVVKKETPVYSLCAEHDEYARRGYFGGRVEVFKRGFGTGKVWYYDFTSHYPAEGRKDLPIGEPKMRNARAMAKYVDCDESGRQILGDGFFGMVEARVRTIRHDVKPLHATIHKSRLLFPYFDEWTTLTLFSEEVKAAQSCVGGAVYEYEFLSGMQFERDAYLEGFFNDAFAKKAQHKRDGNQALTASAKIVANSGYGFWALRWCGRDGVGVYHKKDSPMRQMLDTETLKSYDALGDYDLLRFEQDLDVKETNVAIGAAITAYARTRLWQLMVAIERKGGSVMYCDTDSIICDTDLSQHEDLMDEFIFDWRCGKKDAAGDALPCNCNGKCSALEGHSYGDFLGSLKNEADDLLKDKLGKSEAKRVLREMQEAQGSEHIHFTGWAISGAKVYGLELTLPDGRTLKITKAKGFSQKGKHGKDITMEAMRELACLDADVFGDPMSTSLVQQQMQFRCGKQRIEAAMGSIGVRASGVRMRAPAPFCSINKGTVTKKVTNQYTKGATDYTTGIVSPLTYDGEQAEATDVDALLATLQAKALDAHVRRVAKLGGRVVKGTGRTAGKTGKWVYENDEEWTAEFLDAYREGKRTGPNAWFVGYVRLRRRDEARDAEACEDWDGFDDDGL